MQNNLQTWSTLSNLQIKCINKIPLKFSAGYLLKIDKMSLKHINVRITKVKTMWKDNKVADIKIYLPDTETYS